MKVFGNVDSIKKVIKERFEKDIQAANSESDQKIEELKKENKAEIELIKSRSMLATESECKKIYSKITSEEKLKAKNKFEEQREKLINKVFEQADKKAKTFTHSQEYVDFVNKKMPKISDFSLIADSDHYKKHFPERDIEIDESIDGIKIKKSNVVYDFTVQSAISLKKDSIRQTINQALFGKD